MKPNTRFGNLPWPVTCSSISIHYAYYLPDSQFQVTHEELDGFIAANSKRDESTGHWMCMLCHVTQLQRTDTARHIEARHVLMPPILCSICNTPYKTRDSLRYHMRQKHREWISNTRFCPQSNVLEYIHISVLQETVSHFHMRSWMNIWYPIVSNTLTKHTKPIIGCATSATNHPGMSEI